MNVREHAYNTILIFSALLILELISYFFYYLVYDEWFSYSDIQKKRTSIIYSKEESVTEVLQGKKEVIHPYLGFVYNPDGWKKKHGGMPISEFGFIDNKSPVQKRSENKLLVGIFGGSVAWWFQNIEAKNLIDEIGNIPKFAGKEIVLVPVALGGYKQPQQLMALSYLTSLGAEFDVIINIDGYNEVALVNYKSTVFPFYPRSWELRMVNTPSKEIQSSIGYIEYLKDWRARVARFSYSKPYSLSVTLNTTWSLYDRYLVNTLNTERIELDQKRDKRNRDYYHLFEVKGPSYNYNNREKLYADIAYVWVNSSLAMRNLAEANGADYFHFLQPNQYYPGSKQLNEEELKKAFDENFPHKSSVEMGYPQLIEASGRLLSSGENYHDLSMIFKDVSETAYVDTCCHLTELGNEIMRENILEVLTSHYNKED